MRGKGAKVDLHEVIETMLRDLVSLSDGTSIDESPRMIDLAEEILRHTLRITILKDLNVETALSETGGAEVHVIGEDLIALRICEEPSAPSVLDVAVLEAGQNPRGSLAKLTCQEVPIRGCGRYSLVRINVPEWMASKAQRLGHLAEAIYSAGYSWLQSVLVDFISRLTSETVSALYNSTRALFSGLQEDISESILFVVIHRGQGLYVLDRARAQALLSRVSEDRVQWPQSPLDQFLELASRAIPFDKMASRFAIAEDRCVEVDLRASEYLRESPSFELAEEKAFAARYVSLYPIVREGDSFLVAWFPTRLQGDVLPLLEQHRAMLADIYEQSRDRGAAIGRKVSGRLAQLLSHTAPMGRFLGAFARGFLDPSA